MPSNVYVLGDPRLENPTWDRLFKTGYIDVTGVVRNVLPGEQPVFAVRQANTLRTTPLRWGNIRDRWATTYDASMIKTTRIRENITTQFRFEAFNALNHPVWSAPSGNILAGAAFPGQPATNAHQGFGVISGTAIAMRQLQLALKYSF